MLSAGFLRDDSLPRSKLLNLRSSDKLLLIPTEKKQKTKQKESKSASWVPKLDRTCGMAGKNGWVSQKGCRISGHLLLKPLIFQSVSISFVLSFLLNFISVLDIFYSIKLWQISLSQQLYGFKYLPTIQQRNKVNISFSKFQIWKTKKL